MASYQVIQISFQHLPHSCVSPSLLLLCSGLSDEQKAAIRKRCKEELLRSEYCTQANKLYALHLAEVIKTVDKGDPVFVFKLLCPKRKSKHGVNLGCGGRCNVGERCYFDNNATVRVFRAVISALPKSKINYGFLNDGAIVINARDTCSADKDVVSPIIQMDSRMSSNSVVTLMMMHLF